MKVQIRLHDITGYRTQAVKELRQLTDCGLKEACDLFPADPLPKSGTIFEVNACPHQLDTTFYWFTVIQPLPVVFAELRKVIDLALDVNEYDLAVDLIATMRRRS